MIDLTERLSEFSYGYGITREVEIGLEKVGLRVAPFLPSLIHEKTLGFDVSFRLPGKLIFLQFKLGQLLRRLVWHKKKTARPVIARPFWRFSIDTAEPDGQYELLLKAETDGAETYYVAPRFAEWSDYLDHFQAGNVFGSSLVITPTEIRNGLIRAGEPDGRHKIIYDADTVHVCSEGSKIIEKEKSGFSEAIRADIERKRVPLRDAVSRVLEGFGSRASIRRETEDRSEATRTETEYRSIRIIHIDGEPAQRSIAEVRKDQLQAFQKQTGDADVSMAALVSIEAWALGVQPILVSLQD